MLDYRNSRSERETGTLGRAAGAFAVATAVAGTLDILSAFLFGGMAGVGPGAVLRYVASGPFGDGMREGGLGAAFVGLAVHFSLMAIMVAVFVALASRIEWVRKHWILAGPAYGIVIYLIMNWLVVPTRFGTTPPTDLWRVGNALFSHIVCVGLPIAFIVSRLGGAGQADRFGDIAGDELIPDQQAG